MSRLFALAGAAVVVLAPISSVEAANLVFGTTVASISPDDSFDWDSVSVGTVPNGTTFQSANGISFAVSNTQNNADVIDNGSFVGTQGGHHVLDANVQAPQSFTFSFAAPIAAFGASPEWGGYEIASYTLNVFGFGGLLLGTNTIFSDDSGSPAFLGVEDTSGSNIYSVTYVLDGPTAPHSGVISDLVLRADVIAAAPEPATWAMMLTGFGAIGYGLRRRKAAVSFA